MCEKIKHYDPTFKRFLRCHVPSHAFTNTENEKQSNSRTIFGRSMFGRTQQL